MSEIPYLPVITVLTSFPASLARNILSITTSVISFPAIMPMAPAVPGGKVIEFIPVSGEVVILHPTGVLP
jgi:hypothetical protein